MPENLPPGRGASFSLQRRTSVRRAGLKSRQIRDLHNGFLESKGPGQGPASCRRETSVRLRRYWKQLPATEVGRNVKGASSPLESMAPRSARHTVATTLTVMAGVVPVQRVSFLVRVLAVAGS